MNSEKDSAYLKIMQPYTGMTFIRDAYSIACKFSSARNYGNDDKNILKIHLS